MNYYTTIYLFFEFHNTSFNDFTKSIYVFTESIINVNTLNNINNIHYLLNIQNLTKSILILLLNL